MSSPVRVLALASACLLGLACSKDSTAPAEGAPEAPATESEEVAGEGAPAAGDPAAPEEAASKVTPGDFEPEALGAETPYKGEVAGGLRWRDRNGDNVLILSRLERDVADGHVGSVYLYGNHYATAGGEVRKLREVKDKDERCPSDNITRFEPEALQLSDLDHDGIGEVTFAYRVGCVSDVSPVPLKLLVLEDGDKYIIRGTTRMEDEGEQKIDRSFQEGPPEFLEHARAKWDLVADHWRD